MLARFQELAGAELPLPGAGQTAERWRRLADVATEDLALAKLVESHFDAVAILTELGAAELLAPGQRWAVWAAEPPAARLAVGKTATGRKAWCSGADLVSHALVTGWDEHDRSQLVALALDEPGISMEAGAWQAIGMGRVSTPDLTLDQVPVVHVGKPAGYLERPGFWHGGAGIAACWYGGAVALADAVAARAAGSDDPHLRAHLGSIDVEVRSVRALLLETATWIDQHPAADAFEPATRVRTAADQLARRVLDLTGRALGAGPLCRDAGIAQHFADLPVFIRQTHADRDLVALASAVLEHQPRWSL